MIDLRATLEPAAVAVVGANPDGTRMGGGFVLKALLRHAYKGKLFPVNPRYKEIDGLRCLPSLEAIDAPIDLAVFALPAGALGAALAKVEPGSIKTGLVLSSGFSELGDEGARLERELLETMRAKRIRLVGPNSVGIVNLSNGLVATISQAFDRTDFPEGNIGLVSQSGAFGTALVARAAQAGIGLRYFISSGNEADVGFTDLARALVERDDVRVLCGYLENVRHGPGFVELAKRAAAMHKPLVVLKAGITETGSVAAKSHTGALVGSDAVAQAIFDAYNVIRARDGEHFLELLNVFQRTPRGRGKRIALVSHSGGAGVLAADAAESEGASLPQPSAAVKKALAEKLPAFATIANPLDMTGAASLQAKLMSDCLRSMLEDDAYDAGLLCVALIWREGETLLAELEALAASQRKPFAVSWAAPADEIAAKLRSAHFPVIADAARASAALARKLVYESRTVNPAVAGTQRKKSLDPARFETVAGQIAILEGYGIPLPRQILAKDVDEAETFLRKLGRPVVAKVAAPRMLHRTEAGGVAIGIATPEHIADEYYRICDNVERNAPSTQIEGVLVQEMIAGGAQMFVGMKRDATFGPIVAVAPGGTLVDLIPKPVLRPVPVDLDGALEMLASAPLRTILDGFRGEPALDRHALAQVIVAVSQLALDAPHVAELELNPVIVLPKGCAAVDYKFHPA